MEERLKEKKNEKRREKREREERKVRQKEKKEKRRRERRRRNGRKQRNQKKANAFSSIMYTFAGCLRYFYPSEHIYANICSNRNTDSGKTEFCVHIYGI